MFFFPFSGVSENAGVVTWWVFGSKPQGFSWRLLTEAEAAPAASAKPEAETEAVEVEETQEEVRPNGDGPAKGYLTGCALRQFFKV